LQPTWHCHTANCHTATATLPLPHCHCHTATLPHCHTAQDTPAACDGRLSACRLLQQLQSQSGLSKAEAHGVQTHCAADSTALPPVLRLRQFCSAPQGSTCNSAPAAGDPKEVAPWAGRLCRVMVTSCLPGATLCNTQQCPAANLGHQALRLHHSCSAPEDRTRSFIPSGSLSDRCCALGAASSGTATVGAADAAPTC
jgi:hypothetical protein